MQQAHHALIWAKTRPRLSGFVIFWHMRKHALKQQIQVSTPSGRMVDLVGRNQVAQAGKLAKDIKFG
jgi:hypothetical protein